MDSHRILQSINKMLVAYKQKLSTYQATNFGLTPPIGGWSYSEVYSHIFDASLLSVVAMQNGANNKGQATPTHWLVKLILFVGMFKPGKK